MGLGTGNFRMILKRSQSILEIEILKVFGWPNGKFRALMQINFPFPCMRRQASWVGAGLKGLPQSGVWIYVSRNNCFYFIFPLGKSVYLGRRESGMDQGRGGKSTLWGCVGDRMIHCTSAHCPPSTSVAPTQALFKIEDLLWISLWREIKI
jgi:hypothetical protein